MSKLRRQLSASTNSVVEPKKLSDLKDKTGNETENRKPETDKIIC